MKLLWGLAAARCAFPNCRVECVEPKTPLDGPVILGKIAHIIAHSEGGPRSDPNFPAADLDKYDNWILLCGPHHDIVDGQPNTYTIAELKGWKADHEKWVRRQLAIVMPGVGFAELEIVTREIRAASHEPTSSYNLTPPHAKMKRNNLSTGFDFHFTVGMSKAKEVADYVNRLSAVDANFPEELKAGFVKEYDRLREQGIVGDSLFEALHTFSSGGRTDFVSQAAGLAVLLYLFEKCEIFEQ